MLIDIITHRPIKFLDLAKAIKPEIPGTKLFISSEQSVRSNYETTRINYERSRFKCDVNKRLK